jgi:hypothetical protein
MAQLLGVDDPEVAKVIFSTREILEGLRAKPYLERLRQLAAPDRGAEPVRRAARRSEVAVSD